MRDLIQVRSAQPGDAKVATVLLYSAYTHTSVTSPGHEEHQGGWIERLEHFFRRDGNRFSYQNIQLAEQNLEFRPPTPLSRLASLRPSVRRDSEVVGLVLSFGGQEEAQLNAAVGIQLEREAQDDEWYVDALAVFSNWGHKGIGTCLLQHAEQQARQHHYPKIALHVAQENKEALDLYMHLHYVVTRQTFLYQRPYVRMVKSLPLTGATAS